MKLHRSDIEARCIERGYAWDSIIPCLTRDLGDGWYDVDTSHEAYPRARERVVHAAFELPADILAAIPSGGQSSSFLTPKQEGPGSELKSLLAQMGFDTDHGCNCNDRASQMDAWGCDESEKRLDEIVGWLQEEHAKRAAARQTILPFSKLVAANIVKLAIRRARKKGSTQPN